MGYRAVQRAYAQIARGPFVAQDRLDRDRWSGVIEAEWWLDPEHPVVIGAGWYHLYKPPGLAAPKPKNLGPRRISKVRTLPALKPEVRGQIVCRGMKGVPVIPGSSLKGAVRQVYELLTPSCQPVGSGSCRVRPRDQVPQVCPACSLFGAAGLGGRLSFGEASPVGTNWQAKTVSVPTAWRPRKDHGRSLKVYDPKEAVNQDGEPQKKSEPTWSIAGSFASRIRLINASEEELGLLFGALGLGATTPMLRVGGKKFDGMGGVDLDGLIVRQRYPKPHRLQEADAFAWAKGLEQRAVFDQPERKKAWDRLHAALAAGS